MELKAKGRDAAWEKSSYLQEKSQGLAAAALFAARVN